MLSSKKEAASIARKILTRYVKKGHPMARAALKGVRSGGYVVFEISPAYLTSWDYGKLVARSSSLRDAVVS